MTIRAKLIVCLSLLALAFAGLTLTLHLSLHANRQALGRLMTGRIAPLRDLKVVADKYAVDIVDAAHKARNGNVTMAQSLAHVRDGRAELAAHWRAYAATRPSGHEAILAAIAERRMRAADRHVATLEAILGRGDRPALDRFVTDTLYGTIDPVSAAMSDLIDEQIRQADVQVAWISTVDRGAAVTAWVLAAAAAIVWLVSQRVTQRGVVHRIDRLAGTMEDLAAERPVDIPGVEDADELGRMARACEVFRARGAARIAADQVQAATQARVTHDLQRTIAAVSEGDLTCEIPPDFPADYAAVGRDFNAGLAHLRGLIGSVRMSAASIRTGSSEIALASEDLARRTEQSAANLESTAAEIGRIEARVVASERSAEEMVTKAGDAIATVGNGRAVADEAVAAMQRVSASARGIDMVIEGLDKIAFQTRVLAMNAAVEAGRAGEAGRGFAVVADLVSALAMRAEEEAKRARSQLSVTQSEIVSAVDLVQRVDGALSDIAGDVGLVHGLVGRMAADNQAQATAIGQIARNVTAMDGATQQNAAMVEQTSAAARTLSHEVEGLARQAESFAVEMPQRPGAANATPAGMMLELT
ncbi:methyl-accepting chemotaxis protein [Sphingomonas abaci]|uniref:Methyl-accepting chemotaxis protein n=1 Tax=Sphingomonas abaci TaxID=237611 RepID=A0A7W7EYG3_9SPHN|nr:methyl-accepting chemotaxis protein [Sphingomonas abaci]MBB4618708.1 methyl-accepting chemotaxis protein [Sphingomonas abaci]